MRLSQVLVMFLILLSGSLAQEPLWLGSSSPEGVINLDSGAKSPGYVQSFGTGGFAAPKSPQAMALSPGAMVNQARSLLSEVKESREDVLSICNMTKLMAAYSSENASIARSMAESAEMNAGVAERSAAKGREALNETLNMRSEVLSICNMTKLMAAYISENASIARSMAESAEMNAGVAERSAAEGREALNETLNMRSEVLSIYNMTRLMAAYSSENASIARSMAESAEMNAIGRHAPNGTLKIGVVISEGKVMHKETSELSSCKVMRS